MHSRQAIGALTAAVAALSTTVSVMLGIRKKPRTPNRRHTVAQHRRNGLLHPRNESYDTPWRRVLSTGTDNDFIVVTNFTRSIFLETILPLFETSRAQCNFGGTYKTKNTRRGRKPFLSSVDLLGVALNYLKTSGSMYQLCPFFGVVPSSLSVWLDYALVVLLRATKKGGCPLFRIQWPTPDEQKLSASLLETNRKFGHLLKGVFGITDGGRFKCQNYADPNMQNAYYEGYTQQEEVTNLFVFNFHGEIIHAAINFPGSWHDTKLAGVSGLYYPKLSDELTPPGMAILGDSAFVNNTSCTNGKILRARKTNETHDIPDSMELSAIDLVLQRVMPSERQSAEWGIRAIKCPFQRLKTTLPADGKRRAIIIELAVRLLNCRTRTMGRNQITTTYRNVMQ